MNNCKPSIQFTCSGWVVFLLFSFKYFLPRVSLDFLFLGIFLPVIMNTPLYTALEMNPPRVRLLIPNIFGHEGIFQLLSVFQQ